MDESTWTERAWELSALDFGAGLEPPIPRTRVSLRVEDGRISGSAGCNRYTGPIESKPDGSLRIGDLASTMMACPEPVMAQEQIYLSLLRRVERAVIASGRLEMWEGDQPVLAFDEVDVSIQGDWALWGYNNGKGAIVTPVQGTQITARFEGETMAGSAGCNRYRAACRVEGGGLELGPVMTTRMACAPEVMEQESRYLALLERVASYQIDDTGLDLRHADGTRLLRFVRPETDVNDGA